MYLSISQTPSNTPSNTPTRTPSSTPCPVVSASPTRTPTKTPTQTKTPTVTPTKTVTPSKSPTATPTSTIDLTPTISPTKTPTATPTSTIDVTPSVTPTNTITATPTRTINFTPTVTSTKTPTATPTSTIDPTPSITPTLTPTATQCTCFSSATINVTVAGNVTFNDCDGNPTIENFNTGDNQTYGDGTFCIRKDTNGGTAEYTIVSYNDCCSTPPPPSATPTSTATPSITPTLTPTATPCNCYYWSLVTFEADILRATGNTGVNEFRNGQVFVSYRNCDDSGFTDVWVDGTATPYENFICVNALPQYNPPSVFIWQDDATNDQGIESYVEIGGCCTQ